MPVISIVNQKGGVGKSTTCANLGIGLARHGKKVLVIDSDPQGSLTASLGFRQPDEIPITLATVMEKALSEEDFNVKESILHHFEGVDLIPANIELSGIDISLVNAMGRESILRQCIEDIRHEYDYVLIDCTPSLGMLTINALAAANSVLIPVQAQYLSIKGLEQLLQSIARIKKKINPEIMIHGILLTMVDSRTNYSKDIINLLKETYGSRINIFNGFIPLSVKCAEVSSEGKSIFLHDPNGKVSQAYEVLTKEVISDEEKQRNKY